MIDKRTIFEIHRLKQKGLSIRQISVLLNLDRGTVTKYLQSPDSIRKQNAVRSSKLDPFREMIKEALDKYPTVKAPVILNLIKQKGFDGEITIVRQYLRHLRGSRNKQAFIRFESRPGQQMQIDWGHFGSLAYGSSLRKLYALAVIESYSRMLYVCFTHSQKQAALHQCLIQAFQFFGGNKPPFSHEKAMGIIFEEKGVMFDPRLVDAFGDIESTIQSIEFWKTLKKPGSVTMDLSNLSDNAAKDLAGLLPARFSKGVKQYEVTPTTHFCMGRLWWRIPEVKQRFPAFLP